MRRLKRFLELSGAEKRILLRVGVVVAATRAALWIVPAHTARRVAAQAAGGAIGSVEQLVWAVKAVSRYLPAATCLTQALAAQALLGRSGFPSTVEIGVARDEGRRIRAHAWVVCYGQVVLGGPQASQYNSLTVWNQVE
jgi:hypothetical protein